MKNLNTFGNLNPFVTITHDQGHVIGRVMEDEEEFIGIGSRLELASSDADIRSIVERGAIIRGHFL